MRKSFIRNDYGALAHVRSNKHNLPTFQMEARCSQHFHFIKIKTEDILNGIPNEFVDKNDCSLEYC